MSRFIVTELEGFSRADGARCGNSGKPGLSVQVLDTATCYRVMGSWRTEDYGGSVRSKRAHVRHRAACFAARLNGEPEPPRPNTREFFPTCPRCRRKCDPDAAYCKCGKNLYRQEIGH